MINQFMSDHPNPGNRAAAVSSEIKTLMPRTYLADSSDFRQIKSRVAGMKPLTSEQVAAMQKQPPPAAPASTGDVRPSTNFKVFTHSDYQISYPENWQIFGDQSSSVTIAPPSGVSQNAIAYGVMISNYQPEQGTSLDEATRELVAQLKQSNPDLKQIGHAEKLRVSGVPGQSAELVGSSPIKDTQGKPLEERDWIVTVTRHDGTVLYLVCISPDKDFSSMRPAFEGMVRTLQVK